MGYDEKEIEKATGLSIEEIERIKQKLDKKQNLRGVYETNIIYFNIFYSKKISYSKIIQKNIKRIRKK